MSRNGGGRMVAIASKVPTAPPTIPAITNATSGLTLTLLARRGLGFIPDLCTHSGCWKATPEWPGIATRSTGARQYFPGDRMRLMPLSVFNMEPE